MWALVIANYPLYYIYEVIYTHVDTTIIFSEKRWHDT